MLLRVSSKFQTRFKCDVEKGTARTEPFPNTWSLDSFTHARKKYVLASEESTLFSFIIPLEGVGKGFEAFLQEFSIRLGEITGIHPGLDRVRFTGRTERGIIGSQNQMIYLIKGRMEDEGYVSLDVIKTCEDEIQTTPMRLLGGGLPKEEFEKRMVRS